MEYEYSNTMKRLMRKRPNPIVHILFIVVMAVLAVGCFYGIKDDAGQVKTQQEGAEEFDPMLQQLELCELTPTLLYDYAYNLDVNYCFAFDAEYRTYIVAIKEKDMDRYDKLLEYSYSEDMNATAPEPITLQGMPKLIEGEMAEITVESYNEFFGSEMITSESYKFALGQYYLDTTKGPEKGGSLTILFASIMVLTLVLYLAYLSSSVKMSKVSRATIAKYDKRTLWEVDQELVDPSTVYYKKQKLFLTKNYIISEAHGFDIIPYEAITHVYGCSYGSISEKKRYSIIAETKDGRKHECAVVNYSNNWEKDYDAIVTKLKEMLLQVPFGFEESFFTHTVPKFNIEIDIQNGGEGKSSNIILGIIGALLGALLGGIIWVVVGKLGFIAGLAGYFMMLFAISGYRRLSGFLDKKGQIISVIIALLMIYAANYAHYLTEYMKYSYHNSYSLANITDAIRTLPRLLKMNDLWGEFIKDLVIGYLLSIWASINIFRSIFTKKQ